MTADEALVELLGDLIEAAKQAMLRRKHNTVLGGTVIAALREAGMTYREIEQATGIPHTTAQRWALPPTTARECD